MQKCDFLIIGGGISGAGLGYYLAEHGKTILCEMESQPGYHTTGRSAAFYAESYGNEKVRPLTINSKSFFLNPPAEFGSEPLMKNRGAIHIFNEDKRELADSTYKSLSQDVEGVKLLSREEVLNILPLLAGEDFVGGLADPDCADLDVSAIHQGFLREYKGRGGLVTCDAELLEAKRVDGRWIVKTRSGEFDAGILINCSGAWGDVVAERCGVKSIGLLPLRRTIVTVPYAEVDADGPLILDIEENYYFKPEAGVYLVSPADETLSAPCDAQPEMEDVAIAVDAFEKITRTKVEKLANSWAGLRTFSADRSPVIGFDGEVDGFFWNVGQGGYGIQTAPAWSRTAAHLLTTKRLPDELKRFDIGPETYSPKRFA